MATRIEWEQQRHDAVSELETIALGIERHASELTALEHETAARRHAVERLTTALKAQHVRAATALNRERSAYINWEQEIAGRERLVGQRETRLLDLYQRWGQRRAIELARLREEWTNLTALREEYSGWRDHLRRARLRLLADQRAVTARLLAAEQAGKEVDLTVAEQTSRRTRAVQEWERWCRHQSQELDRAFEAQRHESDALEQQFARLATRELHLAEQRATLYDALAITEREQLARSADRAANHDGQQRLIAERREHARHVAELEAALEHLARLLIDDSVEAARAA